MSSIKKTDNIKLNLWAGTDVPCREDFNNDNRILDSVISAHNSNSSIHITPEDSQRWNNQVYVTTYVGNGKSNRLVDTGCPFNARVALAFAVDYPPSVCDVPNESDYNYFGVATSYGGTSGIALDGRDIRVTSSTSLVQGTEYRNLNDNSVVYVAVLFR